MLKFPHERQILAELHQQLWDAGLVIWTGGNVSQRVEGGFLIKPSGVMYPDLTAEAMVLCDLDGNVIEGTRSPSSDTAAHAYVYRNMPEVGESFILTQTMPVVLQLPKNRFLAFSPQSPMSSAATFRWGHSPSSETIQSAAASSKRSRAIALRLC